MTKNPKKTKAKNTKPRKQLIKCKHCGELIKDTPRREHLKDAHGIVGDEKDKTLIPKSSVRKHFVREDEIIEQPEMVEP